MFSGLIFIISWLLWNSRNARWVRDKVMSHSTLIHRGMDLQQQCQAAKWVLKLRTEGWSLSCCGFCCKCSLKCCWAWLFSFMVLYFLYQVGFLVIATSSWLFHILCILLVHNCFINKFMPSFVSNLDSYMSLPCVLLLPLPALLTQLSIYLC